MSEEATALAAMQMTEACAVLIEACAGYRERCVAVGFDDDDATDMALELHSVLMHRLRAGEL